MDKIDILHKESDVLLKIVETIYKKVFILLATAGGSGSTSIVMLKDGFTIYGIVLLIIFLIVSLGIFTNYNRLNKIHLELEKNRDEIKKLRSQNDE